MTATTATMSPYTDFTPDQPALRKLLRRRMSLPQRHRLLHAYPLHAGMPHIDNLTPDQQTYFTKAGQISTDQKRGLLVGVLPHPFCNPTVRGCGYCTFPHQKYRRSEAQALVRSVIEEITQRYAANPEMGSVPVQGLYFGGGTANLTPVDSLRDLSRVLNSIFHLSQAEVTLEGVPAYFLKRERPLDALQQVLDADHFRISMGIQTFDPQQLKRMGRQAFGNADTFAEVVSYAHDNDITVSGDLLFNLPGQSIDDMCNDLQCAIDIGLDQICLYHLVLFRGLGTEWSRDSALLAQLPSNVQANDNWQVLRSELISAGYVQTTLTNFERAELNATRRHFKYESMSFQPDQFDMLGFGPSGISFFADDTFSQGFKLVNPESATDYVHRINEAPVSWDRYHDYDELDMKLFYLTRRLAGLSIDLKEYRDLFESPIWDDFEGQLHSLFDVQLIANTGSVLVPSPTGMFYADAMASLFVESSKSGFYDRVKALASDSNASGHM